MDRWMPCSSTAIITSIFVVRDIIAWAPKVRVGGMVSPRLQT